MKIISVRRTDIKRARAPRELWGSLTEWHNSLIGSLHHRTENAPDRAEVLKGRYCRGVSIPHRIETQTVVNRLELMFWGGVSKISGVY